MTTFASTPGNSRYEVLRAVVNSPRHRVQRVLEVTRAYWAAASETVHGKAQQRPLYGPGRRPLTL